MVPQAFLRQVFFLHWKVSLQFIPSYYFPSHTELNNKVDVACCVAGVSLMLNMCVGSTVVVAFGV